MLSPMRCGKSMAPATQLGLFLLLSFAVVVFVACTVHLTWKDNLSGNRLTDPWFGHVCLCPCISCVSESLVWCVWLSTVCAQRIRVIWLCPHIAASAGNNGPMQAVVMCRHVRLPVQCLLHPTFICSSLDLHLAGTASFIQQHASNNERLFRHHTSQRCVGPAVWSSVHLWLLSNV
jgi:hypothetical protein